MSSARDQHGQSLTIYRSPAAPNDRCTRCGRPLAAGMMWRHWMSRDEFCSEQCARMWSERPDRFSPKDGADAISP